MKQKIIIILAALSTVFVGQAQQGMTKTTISHTSNLGIGSFGDFIARPSFRGASADIQYFITDKISAGINAGYYDFYQKFGRQLYRFSNEDVSAVKTHSVQMTPVIAKITYHKLRSESSLLQPYASIGAGMNIVNYEEWWGTLVDRRNKWVFAAAPEIGTRIAFSRYSKSGIDLSLRYNYSRFRYADVQNMHTIALNIGVFWFGRD